jgi:hypothetical protein
MRRVHGERSALLGLVLRGRAPVGRAQVQADAGAVLVGAGVTEAVPAMAEKASAVETEPAWAKAAAPPVQEETAATAES